MKSLEHTEHCQVAACFRGLSVAFVICWLFRVDDETDKSLPREVKSVGEELEVSTGEGCLGTSKAKHAGGTTKLEIEGPIFCQNKFGRQNKGRVPSLRGRCESSFAWNNCEGWIESCMGIGCTGAS